MITRQLKFNVNNSMFLFIFIGTKDGIKFVVGHI